MKKLYAILRKQLPYRQYRIVYILIVGNVAMFLLTSVFPVLVRFFAMNPLLVLERSFFWQPLTYIFIHGNTMHLLFNMLSLYFFGMQVERELGSWEFLLFYLICGTLAGVLSLFLYVITETYFVFLMGASGALFAVLLAFATLNPTTRVFIFGFFPTTAATMVLIFTGIQLLFQINAGSNSNIAYFTHLSGFLFAYLYFLLRFNINPIERLLKRH